MVHRRFGSKSKYISTCGSLQAVINFAAESMSPGQIIIIDIHKLPADVEIIDLRDFSERMKYIEHSHDVDATRKFHHVTSRFQEVLLAGYIPNSCIQLVYSDPQIGLIA